MFTSDRVFSYLMRVVNLEEGRFTVTLPPAELTKPGILLSEVAIYDEQLRLRLTNPRYLKIKPGLSFTNFGPIMPSDVRMALWDYCPESNTLLDDYEFPEDMIIHMIRRPLDLWNELTPDVYRASPSEFPWREHWLRCTIGYLLVAASRLMRRNNLSYNASGLSVADGNDWAAYKDEGETLIAEFKQWAQNKKIEINVNRGYSTLYSDYR